MHSLFQVIPYTAICPVVILSDQYTYYFTLIVPLLFYTLDNNQTKLAMSTAWTQKPSSIYHPV